MSALLTSRRRLFLQVLKLRHALARPVHNERKFVPRRAALYVPGNDERKLKKTEGLDVDCVIMDCEDGVALNRKVCAVSMVRPIV